MRRMIIPVLAAAIALAGSASAQEKQITLGAAVQLTGRNVDHWIADLAERIHVGRLQRFQRPADTVPAEAEVAR